MNHKLRYLGLLAIVLVLTVAVSLNLVEASALQKGPGANKHETARYNNHLVCGDHICEIGEKVKMPERTA